MTQLLLTAAPGVQEWHEFTGFCESTLSENRMSDIAGEFAFSEHEEFAEALYNVLDVAVGYVLGSGNFSVVFECPWDETKAIKVGHGGMSDMGDIFEDGWIEYAVYAMRRKQEGYYNPILPDVHEMYVGEDQSFFVALLERYDGEIHKTRDKHMLARRTTIANVINGDKMADDYDAEYQRYAQELMDDPFFPRGSDMHGGNLMYTSDGRVILTDPSSCLVLPQSYVRGVMRKLGIEPPDPEADAAIEQELRKRNHRKRIRANERRMDMKLIWLNPIWVNPKGEALEHNENGLTYEKLMHAVELLNEHNVPRADVPPSVRWKHEAAIADMFAFGQGMQIIERPRHHGKAVAPIVADIEIASFKGGDLHQWLAVDPAKPIRISKVNLAA